jgi:hypothetical protein
VLATLCCCDDRPSGSMVSFGVGAGAGEGCRTKRLRGRLGEWNTSRHRLWSTVAGRLVFGCVESGSHQSFHQDEHERLDSSVGESVTLFGHGAMHDGAPVGAVLVDQPGLQLDELGVLLLSAIPSSGGAPLMVGSLAAGRVIPYGSDSLDPYSQPR